ncbi:hypothetical protein LHYA1_G009072 [Lachnellula hyalina]|uniref:C6 zinc finger domain protein n=1 Tax=Lachnellula hyalina TaxID=1316788 RepID=A0A8H8QTP4_9HELO|nr:uncharacterized protein LHYA1_G009072 [Lachnellula hyalina]TVY22458.1 hypothetical protein LHYA1_G009072 [Lachnellula hyalina]
MQNFSNEDEFRCFCFYREEVAPQLSYISQSIWQTLLLQAGQDQDFVRHAIIAIGGLSRSMKLKELERTGEESPSDPNAAFLYEFALLQYNQFLAGTKTHIAVAKRDQGRRLAMISCLLVVCIESMQLHHQSALLHSQQGFKLIEELKNDNDTPDHWNSGGISPSAPNIIEDELLQQFDRMELQVLALYDTRMGEQHQILKDEGNSFVRNMPEAFVNIDDARQYLELIMRRTFHFMAYAQADKYALLNFKEVQEDAYPKELSRALVILDGLQVQQEMYAAENRRWSKAFESLFRSSLKDINHLDAFQVLMMKIHSLNTTMRLNGHLSSTELIWDSFAPQMENLVGMCRTVFNHPHADIVFGEGVFTFDMGLIYSLLTSAIHCRDRRIRRDALDLLGTRPWREAQWMSLLCADVARFNMETEEDGVGTEYIPEWARVRLTGLDIIEKEWRGTLHGIRGVGDSAVHIQSVRNWSGMGD